jgi:hypothetical protein
MKSIERDPVKGMMANTQKNEVSVLKLLKELRKYMTKSRK